MLPVAEAAARRLAEKKSSQSRSSLRRYSPPARGSLIGISQRESGRYCRGIAPRVRRERGDRRGDARIGLQGRLLRIGTPPVPIASARSLERSIIPDEQSVVEQVLDLF